MEREWRRLANNLNFTLDGVARIFLPAAYARRFRADPPEYVGQISFADQKIPCLALLTKPSITFPKIFRGLIRHELFEVREHNFPF